MRRSLHCPPSWLAPEQDCQPGAISRAERGLLRPGMMTGRRPATASRLLTCRSATVRTPIEVSELGPQAPATLPLPFLLTPSCSTSSPPCIFHPLFLFQRSCSPIVDSLIHRHLLKSAPPMSVLLRVPPPPGPHFELFEHFWVERGPEGESESLQGGNQAEGGSGSLKGAGGSAQEKEEVKSESFVLTASVRANLKDIARAVLVRRYPILLQVRERCGGTPFCCR